MVIKIKEINNEQEIADSAVLLRDSFFTVAKEFGLTENNCPTYPAFITYPELKVLKEKKNIKMFGLFVENVQVGFVAVEKADQLSVFQMHKLAILPEYRNKTYGTYLLNYVYEYVKREKGKKIKAVIINDNTLLKDWYIENGFVELETKNFNHLPFKVCFLEKEISFVPH
ncbi:MAG: GNAT family N-acetyltransferase [Bacillota bacterium]|nr:GNAT family N-acetyltransferase [Bacillota bacterium]